LVLKEKLRKATRCSIAELAGAAADV